MNRLIFSQASVYRLHRLANKVRAVTGVRHKLADDAGLLALIRACAFSNNTQVKWQFSEFVESLAPEQVDTIIASGIDLGYRQAS